MRERLRTWRYSAVEKWKGLTRPQKFKVAGIAAAVLIALILTLFFAFRTVWEPAFENMNAAAANVASEVLEDEGIRSRFNARTGVMYVPRQDFDRAQMAIGHSDRLLAQDFTFLILLDSLGMGTTQAMQHMGQIQVLQSDVRRLIVGMRDITDAMVILNVPNVPDFTWRNAPPSTAAITIEGNRTFTPEDGEAVAMLVSRAVPNLSPDAITVSDGNMTILFADGQQTDAVPGGGFDINRERQIIMRNVSAVETVLWPIFDNVFVSVNADVDWSTVENELLEFTNPVGDGLGPTGFVNTERVSASIAFAPDMGVMGIPGVDENGIPLPPGVMFPGDDDLGGLMAFERQDERDFLYNISQTWTRGGPPGRFLTDSSSVAVTVEWHAHYYEATLRELGTLNEEMSWAQFQAERNALPTWLTPEYLQEGFHEQVIELIQAASGVPNVVLMVRRVNVFHDEEVRGLPIFEIILLTLVAVVLFGLIFALLRRSQPEVIEEIEPELSVEDLLVSSQLEEARNFEVERLEEIRHEKESQVKDQIDKFATEKPESVAQLLRNWINEDWE